MEESFNITHHAEVMTKEREAVAELKLEVEEMEEKNVRIKASVLRMMKELNQKADKKVYSGNQTTINNLTVLTSVLREAFKKIQ